MYASKIIDSPCCFPHLKTIIGGFKSPTFYIILRRSLILSLTLLLSILYPSLKLLLCVWAESLLSENYQTKTKKYNNNNDDMILLVLFSIDIYIFNLTKKFPFSFVFFVSFTIQNRDQIHRELHHVIAFNLLLREIRYVEEKNKNSKVFYYFAND